MSEGHSENRFDVYRTVTQNIVEAIEAGTGTFVMPWHGGGAAIGKPENAYTRMEYHGINVLALWAQACLVGFGSGYWASYKQWQHAGAQVKRGEHGTTIVFFKRLDGPGADAEEEEDQPRSRLVARASRVFNADQVEGWQPPASYPKGDLVETLTAVDTFVRSTGARITHGGSRAFYSIPDDAIQLPDRNRFTGTETSTATEAYYATVLHELVHWTGAAHRLDRSLAFTSKAEIAAEELVAEIGAAFLCADLHVANTPRRDHAAYVANWLELLRGDARAIFTAARGASAAASYLHELVAAT
ncbi:MAG TPA: zincin-like metallopeptidase domain-containing protein [Croceibacterium sp.]|nr:zincin-like metallopeptidase domain-containing protein [Propylenella sp.]HYD25216.1 zincin-like metallopeptidase domain-containing protein [Croceibacterium sp.]